MIKNFVCIECPRGCMLAVDVDDNGNVLSIAGNSCPKGEAYGRAEIENPTRILTSSVLAAGLAIKMVPVRTSAPIPKALLSAAMDEIKKITLRAPVACGDVLVKNFLGICVDLIATREARRETP